MTNMKPESKVTDLLLGEELGGGVLLKGEGGYG